MLRVIYRCPVSEKLGNRRVTGTEQYYTPVDLALELTQGTLKQIPNWKAKTFLEPAGGTGSFVEALKNLGVASVISFDTEPKHPSVQKQNFLGLELVERDLVTISNPPFGRNNALSVPFFNHAAKHSSHIAFLVPRSWRKWSVINRLDPHFHLVADQDVSVVYQDESGHNITGHDQLRTCFQIWEKRESIRSKIKVPDHGFVTRANHETGSVAMRVFGYGCGKLYRDFPRKPNTTMLFLAVSEPSVIDVLEGLDYERFASRTAYTKALSLQEINFLLNEKLLGDGFSPKGKD
jgi:predicted RNA methylase